MADESRYPCAHCGGPCATKGGTCSDICRQVAVKGLWPSPAGPATHDEMVGWIAAEKVQAETEREARVHAELAEIQEKRRRNEEVTVGQMEDLLTGIRDLLADREN
jgi:hypothetical protein